MIFVPCCEAEYRLGDTERQLEIIEEDHPWRPKRTIRVYTIV
jgi:hypothetical protein